MSDNIDPGNEFSSREFQRKLFDWFDKRGLLSELRAFMRHRMISALYSSESPCPASHLSNLAAVSPTLQAFLLLVGEFLVQQEFHYTMSVMVAEAPLLASFPKFSDYVSYLSQADASATMKGSGFPRYSAKDVQEILEVLGMTPESESVEHILRLYSNNNARESLLACVVTALSAIAQSRTEETSKQYKSTKNRQRKLAASDNATQWIEEVRLVLLRAQLTSHQLQQVEDLLRKLQSDTTNRVRQEENEKNCKLNHIYEQELLAEALVREEKFRAQIQEAEEDLRSKQKHLEKVTIQLQQQHDEVLNRLNRVQKHADEIKKQENELAERENALEKKQALLEDEHRTLVGLRAELQEATHSLRQDHSGTKTMLELTRLKERCLHLESELKETKHHMLASSVCRAEMGVQATDFASKSHAMPAAEHQENHISSENSYSSIEKPSDNNKKERSSQVSLLKRVVCRVQQENSELRAIAAQQRKRIDELTNRAAQLANHIVDQANAPSPPFFPQASLGSQRSPQPPPLPPRHVRSQVGAGSPILQNTTCNVPIDSAQSGKYAPRKSPKRLMQNISLTSSFSSDESPTEEILQEAKNRLKKLEQESEALDRSYRDFQARQADSRGPGVPSTLSTKEFDQINLTPNFASDVTMHFTQMPPAAPSWRQGTPFTASHPGQLATPSVSSSLQSVPKIVPGTPTFPKSYGSPMFSSRSAYSFPRLENFSRLPTSYSSVASRSFVFRRPIERLRNLLGRDTCDERYKSVGHNGANLTAPLRNSGYLPNKAADISMGEQIDNAGNKNAKASCEAFVSPDQMALQGIQEINQSSVINDLKGQEGHAMESQWKNTTQVAVNEGRNMKDNTDHQAPAAPSKPSLNEAKDKDSNIRDHVMNTLKSSNHEEKDVQSPKTLVVPSHNLVEETPTVVKSLLTVEQPELMSLNIECLSPDRVPVQPSADLKHAIKSSTFDATLNEISTLSSSPALSSVHTTNFKGKATTDSCFADPQGTTNADESHSLSILVDDNKYNEDIGTEFHGSDDVKKSEIQNEVKNLGESRVSQLLHTSLSSIENSDLVVSAGSEGKKTDEDDDFW